MAAVGQKIWRYKYWLSGLAVILLTAAAVYAVMSDSNPPAKVATVTVERGDIAAVVSATGTINPVNMVDISSKISGRIREVYVAENQPVKGGQILLTLDDTHLQTQVQQAYARLAEAAGNYERNRRLQAAGAVSDQQLDTAQTDYRVAQAVYDDTVSQLDDTVIKSPLDGVVIGKPIPAGQAVAPGISSPMVLMTVADLTKMQIQTQVDESDIGQVQVGQPVTFTVDAYPGQSFTGAVSNVSQKATVQQNVVYYNVLVDVDNPGGLLKPTMTARVLIKTAESKNTIIVPLSVVKTINGQPTVAVVNGTQTQNVPVTTGLANDDKIEILSGLADGDQIVAPKAKTAAGGESGGSGGGRGTNVFRGLGR